jgi:HD-GYP domain-containing protein (c-di-GMP phosphodiesterase class II)
LGLAGGASPPARPWARRRSSLDERLTALVVMVGAVTAAVLAVAAPQLAQTVGERPQQVATLLALTLMLQLFSVQVYGRGSVSVSAIGILASAFFFNTGTAMAIALTAALVQWVRRRGQLHKAAFDAANFALSAAAASLLFHALEAPRLLAAVLAGSAFALINNGLLCLAMSLAEHLRWRVIWNERFHWARFHFALFGPLALAATIAYEQTGATGLAAFALPPALMILSVRQYLERTIAALSRSMDAKDVYTGGHIDRVAAVAVALAKQLGFKGEELEAIEIGALLHDIGKIGVPEQILRKDGALDSSEWEVIKTHPLISDYILSELDLHPFVRQCARSSHERIDGAGYPDGLSGESIPVPARIVFVADAFDALTSSRPYRPARTPLAALAEIRANAGSQFCPDVVAALDHVWKSDPSLLATKSEEACGAPPEIAPLGAAAPAASC